MDDTDPRKGKPLEVMSVHGGGDNALYTVTDGDFGRAFVVDEICHYYMEDSISVTYYKCSRLMYLTMLSHAREKACFALWNVTGQTFLAFGSK